jgi:hypothetical protein
MAALTWTSSGDGPLVVLPLEVCGFWKGVKGDPSDFDRACDDVRHKVVVAGWVETGSLPVEEGLALVLDGDTEAAWIQTNDGGHIVRGGKAFSEEVLKKAIGKIPKAEWVRLVDTLELMDGHIVIVDAAARGNRDPAKIEADVAPVVAKPGAGKYRLDVASYDVPDADPVSVVRLTRI